MNALLFSPYFNIAGGAVIAANRLFNALQGVGINTKMLVGNDMYSPENDRVKTIPHNFTGEKILSRLTIPQGLNYIHYYSSFRLKKHPFVREADILNFHMLQGGYFNYLAIPRLTKNKPAVYTLHDMWSFTGHCSHSHSCQRWQTGCGSCPDLNDFPAVKKDNTALEWKLKNRVYKNSNLTIVTPSKWLAELAKKSMLRKFDIHHIPGGLDTTVFKPIDKEYSRNLLKIPHNKKVILTSMSQDVNKKGGDILLKALNNISPDIKKSLYFLTLGHNGSYFSELNIDGQSLGYVYDDLLKAIAFSAADIFVLPSRADNLPCTIQESMACGTPVVASNIGGIPEMVIPGSTGFLSEPENADDLMHKIVHILQNDESRKEMGRNSHETAAKEFSLPVYAKRYADLFTEILSRKNSDLERKNS